MIYKVEKRDDVYYVIGLKIGVSLDCVLICKDSEQYFTTTISDDKSMCNALDNLCRVHLGVNPGDVFDTEFGLYTCTNGRVCIIVPEMAIISKE